MPGGRLTPDLAACFAALAPEDRAAVARWEDTLGLPAGGWRAVPALRELVATLAAVRLAAEMPDLSRSDALAEACELSRRERRPVRPTELVSGATAAYT